VELRPILDLAFTTIFSGLFELNQSGIETFDEKEFVERFLEFELNQSGIET